MRVSYCKKCYSRKDLVEKTCGEMKPADDRQDEPLSLLILLPMNETNAHQPDLNWTSLLSDRNTSDGEEFNLEEHLGPRYRSVVESGILIAVYSAIFLTGILGNTFTCIVIIRNKRMHTATNYYLFSLAISDLLTLLLGLPPELYTILEAYPWRFGEPYCLFKTFLTEMTSSASILTIAFFTVERYLAICHSLRAQVMSSLSRAVRNIAIIWTVACITAVPYPIHTRTYYYLEDPITRQPIAESLICNIPQEWMDNMRFAFQISTFLLFVLPMALISALYVQIGMALRRSELRRTQSSSHRSGSGGGRTPTRSHSRKSVFQMLVAVVVAFFICWAPFHAQRLMTIYVRDDQWTDAWLEIQSILFYVSGILYFVSCTVNPILYNLISRNYRQAFMMTLCCFCITDSGRLLRLRYAGTVFYSERTAPSASAGLATIHCPDSVALTSNWRHPSVKNRTRSRDPEAAAAETGAKHTTEDFMAKANCIEEIIKEVVFINGTVDASSVTRGRSPSTLKQKI